MKMVPKLSTHKALQEFGQCREVGDWAIGTNVSKGGLASLDSRSHYRCHPRVWETAGAEGQFEEVRDQGREKVHVSLEQVGRERIAHTLFVWKVKDGVRDVEGRQRV